MVTHITHAERDELRRIVDATQVATPTSQIMVAANVSYARVRQAERAGLIILTENGYLWSGKRPA